MATMFNILLVVMFFGMIAKVNCQCAGVSELAIVQTNTGALVANKPEWSVTITNNCPCSQLNINLACNGFQTAENIDPSVLSQQGGLCLINNGAPIFADKDFTFKYAWDQQFPFQAVQSQVACS